MIPAVEAFVRDIEIGDHHLSRVHFFADEATKIRKLLAGVTVGEPEKLGIISLLLLLGPVDFEP